MNDKDIEEMRRLVDVGFKAANESLAILDPSIPYLDPYAPGAASLMAGVAAMIIASKERGDEEEPEPSSSEA